MPEAEKFLGKQTTSAAYVMERRDALPRTPVDEGSVL